MTRLYYLDLVEVGRRIQAQEVSSVEVTKTVLERIDELDRQFGSYVRLMPDEALADAQTADTEIGAGRSRGPLHGVPVAVKDLFWTKGVVTAAGTSIFRDFIPDTDSTVVARLREAGAVIVGKTVLTEGAFADHHPSARPPISPWSARHWPGVSSTGSAIATATGMCFGSLGSDTGGSIRFPAAANGCTGLKPTWGRVSRYGGFALAPTLDHVGPITRTAEDAGAMLNAIAGPDPRDATANHVPVPDYLAGLQQGFQGIRVGIDPDFNSRGVDQVTRDTVSKAVEMIRTLAGDIRSVRFPNPDQAIADFIPLNGIETAFVHEATYPSRKNEYGSTLAGHIERGRNVRLSDYRAMCARRYAFREQVCDVFNDIDLLVIPVSGIAAFTLEQMAMIGENAEVFGALLRFASPLNMSGHPTLTLPGGFTDEGVPVGFQLVAPHFREELLVRAGWAYQQATVWHRKRPID